MDWRLRRYQTLFATQIRLGETCMVLRNWISILIPKAEDGNNFGVEVQEQCLVKLVGKALLGIEHVLKLKFRGRERNADGSWADGGVSPWTIANSRKVDYLPRYWRLLVSFPTFTWSDSCTQTIHLWCRRKTVPKTAGYCTYTQIEL